MLGNKTVKPCYNILLLSSIIIRSQIITKYGIREFKNEGHTQCCGTEERNLIVVLLWSVLGVAVVACRVPLLYSRLVMSATTFSRHMRLVSAKVHHNFILFRSLSVRFASVARHSNFIDWYFIGIRRNKFRCHTILYDTIRYDTIRHDTIRYDTIRYDKTITVSFDNSLLVVGVKLKLYIFFLSFFYFYSLNFLY